MIRTKHNDAPGSEAWHARRARCFNAGDASAMLGCHPSGKTRTQLLHQLHTGIEPEFGDYVQEHVLNPGHRIEALWRPIAEEIIGEDLQVVAFTLDIGLSRPLGASLDGCTFMEDTLGECKTANEALRAALPHSGRDSHTRNDARNLPKGYRTQCEQQQLATGATRTLFSACQFDAAGNPTEERHCWYESDPPLRAEIIAGWKQADADLAAYTAPAPAAVAVVAAPVQALPAVTVLVEGSIAIRDNFAAFEVALRDFLEHRLIRTPKTDQDFADLDVQIKAMKGAEAALESAEGQMLSQIATVDQAKKTKDMLARLVRENRLMAEKLLASEKERRRGEIVAGGIGALKAHVDALNKRLGKNYMPATATAADFGSAIKGKKSLASMEDAVSVALANAKIAANEVADRIDANLKTLRELAADHAFLFADTAALVLKAPDDCRAVIESRIAAHREQEEKRLAAERERIRAEEEARARAAAAREQQEREAAERRQREEQEAAARRQAEEDAADARRAEQARMTHSNGAPMFGAHVKENGDRIMLDAQGKRSVFCDVDESDDPAPTANVLPMPTKAPAAPAPRILTLGSISQRLGFTLSASFVCDTLGVAGERVKAATMFSEPEFDEICVRLERRIENVRVQHQQRAA